MVYFAMKGTEMPDLLMENMIQIQLKLLNTTVTDFAQYAPYVYHFLLKCALSALTKNMHQEVCMALMMLAQFFGLSPVRASQAKAMFEDLEILKDRGVLINTCAQRLLAVVCKVHPSLLEEIQDPDVLSCVDSLKNLQGFGQLPYLLKLKSERPDVWCAEVQSDAMELDGREKPVTRLFVYRERTHWFTRGFELMIITQPDSRQILFRGKHNAVFEQKLDGRPGVRIMLMSEEGQSIETFWAELGELGKPGNDILLYYREWRPEEHEQIQKDLTKQWAVGIL